MSESRREVMLAGAILLVGLLGLGAQALSDPVSPPAPVPAEARHVERATFCPPPVDEEQTSMRAAIAPVSGEGIPIDFEDATTSTVASPAPPENSEVAEGAFLLHEGAGGAFNAVGYGDKPIGGAIQSWTKPATGAGATLCSERPSDTWYFPAGSSELGFDERLLLYNPFPDEAVARVTFFTPTGERAKASLDDVAVPSGGSTEIEVNKFMNTQKVLSATVESLRGRLMAWKVLFVEPDGAPEGATFTIGAPEPAPKWFFPQGFLGDGAEETLSILNPTEEEVSATVTIFSPDVGLGPADLPEIQLEPSTSQEISMEDLKLELAEDVDLAHLSVVVTSNQGIPIVVERSVTFDEGADGVTSEVGITKPGTRWLLPPLAKSATEDELVILNSGRQTAQISAQVMTLEGTESPKALSDLKVARAGRLERSLSDLSVEGPFFVVVTSDHPITVERRAQVGTDLADVMGRSVAPLGDE